ncbi:MAG: ABC transporter permease, partial [Bryobacteraceae bacterium]
MRLVLGQVIQLGGKGYTVIGVLPPRVSFPLGNGTVMTPFAAGPHDSSWNMARAGLQVIGRLRDGATPAAARAQLRAIQAALAQAHAGAKMPPPQRADAVDYRQELVGPMRPVLHALTGATALVWLLACLSVAG